MQFKDGTVDVLKNFSTINTVIMFKEGAILKTVSPSKTIAAKATLPQAIPRDFGIGNLPRFLNVISLFDDPDIDLLERNCVIKGKNGAAVQYVYGDEEILAAKVKTEWEIDIPDPYVTFNLKATEFQSLLKAAGVLGVTSIAVVGDGKNLTIRALDPEKRKNDVYSIHLGETNKKFQAVFKTDNLKVVIQDYTVTISDSDLMSHFGSTGDLKIEYWLAMDADASEFE